MSSDFASSVEYGLMLSRRIYYGKAVKVPPFPEPVPAKSSPDGLLPTAVMAYAVVTEPAAVDNPDVPSYQPYVHGRCEPPALVPLHMRGVQMEVDCWLDTAFLTVKGEWRVHCIKAGERCDCCIAVPLGEKGSLLGVEVDIHGSGRSYSTILKNTEDVKNLERVPGRGYGGFLKSCIYTIKIPLVGGGSILSIKVSWSQRLLYEDGQFLVNVPFSFPAYVIPVGKKVSKREKILLNVNSGIGGDILCKCTSHPLKELNHEVGKLSFLYEAEVPAWSNVDFSCSYSLSSNDIIGGVLLKSPSLLDFDEREMFCLYLLPGANQHGKVFKREVIFMIDISRSMEGAPLEDAKNALLSSLSKLNLQDSFNIVAFNEEIYLFSSSMELATQETIANVTQWLSNNLLVGDGTNILLPLKQAMELLGETTDTIPLIFLITDGAVEDEREVCNVMKSYLTSGRSITPRIFTFGIGKGSQDLCFTNILLALCQTIHNLFDLTTSCGLALKYMNYG